MTIPHSRKVFALAPAFAAIAAVGAASADGRAGQEPLTSRSRVALSRSLPPMDGHEIRVKLVDVTYPPGGANTSHTHPCPVVGYVLEGALRMKVGGGPEVVYRAGETFYEAAGDVHQISANASATEPARFLAYFVCDSDVAQLSSPIATPKDREKAR